VLNPETFTPFPKNPVIAAFFRQIGQADELGSGMRKLMKYGKAYGGADPEMVEGDIFRIIVAVPEFQNGREAAVTPQVEAQGTDGTSNQPASAQQAPSRHPASTQQVTPQVAKLLAACIGEAGRAALMEAVGIRDRVSFSRNYIQPALDGDLIEMTQPDSPTSPTQGYRLTPKGRAWLEGNRQ